MEATPLCTSLLSVDEGTWAGRSEEQTAVVLSAMYQDWHQGFTSITCLHLVKVGPFVDKETESQGRAMEAKSPAVRAGALDAKQGPQRGLPC